MLTSENNQILTRVGPGTAMGGLFRHFWQPALLSEELSGPDCPPVRVRLMGEDFVAFRDSAGRVGLLDSHCPHRLATSTSDEMRRGDSDASTTAGNSA